MPRESGLGESWTRQVRARHRRPASSCVRSPYPSTTQHPSHYPSLVPRLSRPSGLLHASWPSWLPAPHAWARRPAALRSAPARPTARRSIHATLCTSLVARSTIFSRPSLASCISSPCAARTARLGTPPCRVALCTRAAHTARQPAVWPPAPFLRPLRAPTASAAPGRSETLENDHKDAHHRSPEPLRSARLAALVVLHGCRCIQCLARRCLL